MKKVLPILAVLVLLVAGYGVYMLNIAGQFKSIDPHFAGTCTTINNVVGAEDITILNGSGLALIAAADRRRAHAGEKVQGAIWGYDLTQEKPTPINLTTDFTEPFGAHGLDHFTDGTKTTVMAVNHGEGDVANSGADSIEFFDLQNGKLVHTKTYRHELLRAVNDVMAIDHERFYATIDHAYSSGIMRKIEDYGRLKLGSVVYFDGKTVQTVAEGFRYTNGINHSADGKTIYVAATTDGTVSLFDRNMENGSLSNRRDFDLGTGVDNIEVDSDGALWIGSHPRLFDFLAFAKDANSRSPSQVLKVTFDGDTPTTEEVYLNDGDPISGSGSGARWGDRLLVGTVYDPHFIDCQMK